jgi:hypothetical protein
MKNKKFSKRGFSLIEFVIYVAITALVLLLVQNSVGYFKQKIILRIAAMNEFVYVQRGMNILDTLFMNAVMIDVSTSTDGFNIEISTYLDDRIFLGGISPSLISVHTMCSVRNQKLTLSFVDRNKMVDIFSNPYVYIESCGISNEGLTIQTARKAYSHSLTNFSQFLLK